MFNYKFTDTFKDKIKKIFIEIAIFLSGVLLGAGVMFLGISIVYLIIKPTL